MRHSGLRAYRPLFRSPGFPYIQWGAVAVYLLVIVEMGTIPLLLTGGFALLAMTWYLAYVRPRVERESAILYLVKRIAARAILRDDLERELNHIALERPPQPELDWFDQLVVDAVVLDIPERMPAKSLLERVSRKLAPRVGTPADELYELFLQREQESSTVILPEIAIPHIIVPGRDVFDLLLVRCRAGTVFSELNPPVKVAFVLVGSEDQRNRHLRALMRVAKVVQQPDFEHRWLAAESTDELRQIVLSTPKE
jgi:mannitol/fructose-specific phosphotransferase system IIA component (Ntr-type)